MHYSFNSVLGTVVCMMDAIIFKKENNALELDFLIAGNQQKKGKFFKNTDSKLIGQAKRNRNICGVLGGDLKSNNFAVNEKNNDFLWLPTFQEKKSIDLQIAKKAFENKKAVCFFLSEILSLNKNQMKNFTMNFKHLFPVFLKAKTGVFIFSGETKRSWRERITFSDLCGFSEDKSKKNEKHCEEFIRKVLS